MSMNELFFALIVVAIMSKYLVIPVLDAILVSREIDSVSVCLCQYCGQPGIQNSICPQCGANTGNN